MQRSIVGSLLLLLAATGWAEPPRWYEVRSPHFTVLTNDSEKDARHVAGQLERMRTVFRSAIPSSNDDGEPPILVFALRDRKSFESLEPEAYLARHDLNISGMFLRGLDGSTILLRLDAEGEHPYATVYSEYTHYILRKSGRWLPAWLNVGLAEFYQNTDIGTTEVRMGQPSRNDLLYLRQNHLLPVTTLLTIDSNSPELHNQETSSLFFAESWALTHYLYTNDKQQGTHLMENYAAYLLKGEASIAAAQHAFGDLNKLQQTLDQYVSHFSFLELRMPIGVSENEASYQGRPLSEADVDAERAEVLIKAQRQKEAQVLLEADLQANPKNALAHQALGELYYQERKYEDAKKWYGEAVELDPDSYRANFYFAASCVWTNDRDHDAAVEADLKKAIALAPKFADSYQVLADFYMQRHEHLTEAHQLNIKAVQLDPENIAFRVNAAKALAQDHQLDAAFIVLKSAKAMTKTSEEIAVVDDTMAWLEKTQAKEEKRKAMAEAAIKPPPASSESSDTVTEVPAEAPEHIYPKAPPTGPMQTVSGVIRNVHCHYPTVLVLSVDQGGKMIPLYSSNYFKVDFRTSNYVPKDPIEPCRQIEGMKAKVQFAAVSTDATVVGQVVSIELSK